MKGFNHLQSISIKNTIFNVTLNIFLFNNWKKSNACRFLNSHALKWYEARRLEKIFRESNFVQMFGPSYKKNGVFVINKAYHSMLDVNTVQLYKNGTLAP